MPQAGPPATTQQPPPQTDRELFRQRIREQLEDVRQATADADQPGAGGAGGAGGAVAVPGGPTPPANPDFFTETGTPFPDDIPPRVFDMGIAFFVMLGVIIIGYPLAKAIGKWIVSYSEPAKIPADLTAQLARINQSVDAIAIEVERISEAQRFTTKLLTEKSEPARVPGSARV